MKTCSPILASKLNKNKKKNKKMMMRLLQIKNKQKNKLKNKLKNQKIYNEGRVKFPPSNKIFYLINLFVKLNISL